MEPRRVDIRDWQRLFVHYFLDDNWETFSIKWLFKTAEFIKCSA